MAATFLTVTAIVITVSLFLCRLTTPGIHRRIVRLDHANSVTSSVSVRPESLAAPASRLDPSMKVSALTKTEAEDMLDWLEANGRQPALLSYIAGQGFLVREA